MTSKEALDELCDLATPNGDCINYVIGISGIILKALDRLELLEKIFSDSHICEIKARFNEIECSADKCDNCPLGIGDGICLKNTFEKKWELQKENKELWENIEKYNHKFAEIERKKADLKLENSNLKHSIDEKNEIIGDLEEEVKDTASFYMIKCEKFEKAIEIVLKYEINLIKVKQFNYEGYVNYCKYVNLLIPTQQEYDLLKEVLE